MDDHVKGEGAAPKGARAYTSAVRTERAANTRRAVLEAARACFVKQGYAATTVAQIAVRAGVAVDTVYAAVGRKPALLRDLVETSLSGTDDPVPALQREYVQKVRATSGAAAKLEAYAAALVEIHPRLAPIFLALREAAVTDASCARLWSEISQRRADNMLQLAADLRATDELRSDLTDRQVADIIWSMNAVEYWLLLVGERGWTPTEFRRWVSEAWIQVLLSSPPAGDRAQRRPVV